MLKTLFPKQQVMAVAAVSGTDEKGNPGERYSSEGCHTIMQCILAEKNISFHEYLTKCETSRGMIVSFNSGNPTEFLKLIELFLSEVKDLVQAGKPFNKLYKAQINIHQRDASVFRELAPDLNNLIKNTNLETLAIPVTWGGLEERYTYVRSAIDSIKKHFNVEHLNQLTKKIEVEKATKRATKFIFIVLGIFVLMCAALFKSTYDAEQARLRRIEQDHLESDRKKQTERIEAEKLHVKHLEDVKRLKESALDALVKARQANEIELWQSCLAQVDKVLAIDSGNIEASAIKAEAYKYLMPTLTIEVESGGDKIGAIVTEGEKTWVAPCTISLSQNMRYYFRVSATEPTKWIRYKDESLYVTADWCGPKIRCISLEAVNRPVEGKNWRSPSTGIEFVWISSLKMWVGKYEVTNGEYRRMKPGHDSKSYSQNTLNMDSQPVVFVTSDDAKAYADWLTNVENEVLKKMRYRLPTSSEFISYAKCGDNRRYPWGNSGPPKFGNYFDITGAGLSHSPNMFDPHAMNNYDDGYMVSAPVRFSGENEWGLFGVGGNVRECTSSAPPWMGGSWCCSSVYSLECTATLYMDGSRCFYDSGFRLVLSPETE
jgi:formylglycine-generating enzyme required for sulfatase activity